MESSQEHAFRFTKMMSDVRLESMGGFRCNYTAVMNSKRDPRWMYIIIIMEKSIDKEQTDTIAMHSRYSSDHFERFAPSRGNSKAILYG